MDDFFTFLQLFVIFMISSGAAITAVVYPHYPLGLDLFSKAFVFRGLMTLFTSQMSDLQDQSQSCTINATSQTESEYACLRLANGLSFKCKDIKIIYQKNLFYFIKMIILMHIIDMEYHHHDVIKHHG
jgi:hypothetical protein